jgi:adenine-specific DNA-methyltransferase
MREGRDIQETIVVALAELGGAAALDQAAREFFRVLGYSSDRNATVTSVAEFLDLFDHSGVLNASDRQALQQLTSFQFLFQYSDSELRAQAQLFDEEKSVDTNKFESYLFFAVELPRGHYTRTSLSQIVRAINKPLLMPALVLFRYEEVRNLAELGTQAASKAVSLGIIRRRLHKRDQSKDVLDKVTLIKDIACVDPIRAHIEILNDFAFANLDADYGVSNFVRLHEAWQRRLGSYELSDRFYREIADWYFWADHLAEEGTIRLPQSCSSDQDKSLFLIRLLTRVIFCWFLVEKRLIPTELFRPHRLNSLLKHFAGSRDPEQPDSSSSYYHAVLQNLFFGTLNMPTKQRAFREKQKDGQKYDKNYGITNLWRYENEFQNPDDWISTAVRVPFLNGGLFDCLDDKSGKRQDNSILDGFSDNPDLSCHLPNDLFFGPERTVDLSRDYGEEDKRSARSQKAKVRGLIEILSHYKFTIEENTPLEEEIALDPELLGKVFENLLASYNEDTRTTARKALGAFYTPREIVSYMVDEALKAHLSSRVPQSAGALDSLFSKEEALQELDHNTREALVEAIGRVRILDPACGSGAFPMGALHRLVDLLQKLDPNNESWKRDRLRDARRHAEWLKREAATDDEICSAEDRISDIEKSFDTRFHALDFARKLYLIENCIYGVDIQPIATQIAKLRFFISLVVDQHLDPLAPNLGVRPLPNLETRIVAADTLMPIEMSDSHLFSDDIDKLRSELSAIRHEHFNARSPDAKRKWRGADAAKRGEIAALLQRESSVQPDSAQKLAAWDPYDQNTSAPFFDAEWMFGKTALETGEAPASHQGRGSFDIVIGNPPFIRIQTLKQKEPGLVEFYRQHYKSAAKGNYDIYVVFIEAGLGLLRPDGHLAYICPHKFFNTAYGEPTRRLISRGRLLSHVVHFGNQQVFPGATNYVCLLFLSPGGSDACRWLSVDSLDGWLNNPHLGKAQLISAARITASEWNFSGALADNLLARLQTRGTQLLDLPISMSRGSSSGDDFVFIVEASATHIEVEILRTPVFATDFGSFEFVPCGDKRIIFPYRQVGLDFELIPERELKEMYPNCFRYLSNNRSRLEARKGYRVWYGYSAARNLRLHENAHILVPLLAGRPSFAMIPKELHGTLCPMASGGFTLTVGADSGMDPDYVVGLLNTSVLFWVLRHISNAFRGGWITCTKQYFGKLPIIRPTAGQEQTINAMVRLLTAVKRILASDSGFKTGRESLMTRYFERILNGLAYELYFPEELHEAHLHIFDLVAKDSELSKATSTEELQLSDARNLLEGLFDGSNPLRIALEKLQTLDSVRVIEGKA